MVADGTALLQFDNFNPILAVFRLSDKSFPICPLSGEVTKLLFALRFYLDDKRCYERNHFYKHWAGIAA